MSPRLSSLTRSRFLRIVAPGLMLCLSLSACDGARKAFGMEKAPPDEFQVVQRAPLSLPPDFNLRPPVPGLVRPQEGSTIDQAKGALTGAGRGTPTATTVFRDQGDVALMKRAGSDNAQSNIRDLVNKETLNQAEADKSFTDKLVFWRDPAKVGDKEQVNPVAEDKRLRENQALGKGVTDGETPRIEKGRTAPLEGLMNWLPF